MARPPLNMTFDKITIGDSSGDKDFFTIVPNYILNHSTAIDQALYLQLKRLSGDGKKDYCYPSINYLQKQLHIRKKAVKASLNYLVEHKWIDNLGKKQVHTAGGMQWVTAYKINNIWELNNKEYVGSSQSTPPDKGITKEAKVVTKEPKGVTASYAKQERNKKLIKEHSFKKLKPYFRGMQIVEKNGKQFCIPKDGSQWLEFAGKKEDIKWE